MSTEAINSLIEPVVQIMDDLMKKGIIRTRDDDSLIISDNILRIINDAITERLVELRKVHKTLPAAGGWTERVARRLTQISIDSFRDALQAGSKLLKAQIKWIRRMDAGAKPEWLRINKNLEIIARTSINEKRRDIMDHLSLQWAEMIRKYAKSPDGKPGDLFPSTRKGNEEFKEWWEDTGKYLARARTEAWLKERKLYDDVLSMLRDVPTMSAEEIAQRFTKSKEILERDLEPFLAGAFTTGRRGSQEANEAFLRLLMTLGDSGGVDLLQIAATKGKRARAKREMVEYFESLGGEYTEYADELAELYVHRFHTTMRNLGRYCIRRGKWKVDDHLDRHIAAVGWGVLKGTLKAAGPIICMTAIGAAAWQLPSSLKDIETMMAGGDVADVPDTVQCEEHLSGPWSDSGLWGVIKRRHSCSEGAYEKLKLRIKNDVEKGLKNKSVLKSLNSCYQSTLQNNDRSDDPEKVKYHKNVCNVWFNTLGGEARVEDLIGVPDEPVEIEAERDAEGRPVPKPRIEQEKEFPSACVEDTDCAMDSKCENNKCVEDVRSWDEINE